MIRHMHIWTRTHPCLTNDLKSGNVCLTISNITNNYFYCNQNNLSFVLLLALFILQGLSFLLVFMTALELICAHAGSSSTEKTTDRYLLCFTDY